MAEPRMEPVHHLIVAALGCLLMVPVRDDEWTQLLAELQAGLGQAAVAAPPAMEPVILAAQGLLAAEEQTRRSGRGPAWGAAVWAAHDALSQFFRWRLGLAREAMKKQPQGGQHEAA